MQVFEKNIHWCWKYSSGRTNLGRTHRQTMVGGNNQDHLYFYSKQLKSICNILLSDVGTDFRFFPRPDSTTRHTFLASDISNNKQSSQLCSFVHLFFCSLYFFFSSLSFSIMDDKISRMSLMSFFFVASISAEC